MPRMHQKGSHCALNCALEIFVVMFSLCGLEHLLNAIIHCSFLFGCAHEEEASIEMARREQQTRVLPSDHQVPLCVHFKFSCPSHISTVKQAQGWARAQVLRATHI